MNAVPFDTLKLAQRVQAVGLAAPVAAGTAEALAEAISEADLATKGENARPTPCAANLSACTQTSMPGSNS